MFKTAQEAITYIENKRAKRTFLQFQETIQKYKIPQRLPFTIHVAGTNGKGSTVQYVREILQAHGYRVGTFTSPYMIIHNDRICINGKPISDTEIFSIINRILPIIEEEGLSMFEIDVLIMLLYFSKQPLDFCIIETGIGGLVDKTNVIQSQISAITNIGFDHQAMLGSSLESIAIQKAGIIKENQTFITTEIHPKLQTLFSTTCQALQSECVVVPVEEGKHFTFQNTQYSVPQLAHYALANAKLATVISSYCISLKPKLVQQGINQFSYPGRFEQFGNIYLDGAHNVPAIQALKKTIENLQWKNVGIVFSALEDKEIDSMIEILKEYPILLATFDDDRVKMEGAKPFLEQIATATKTFDYVVVTGSLHFISEVRKHICNIS